jgi:hypothetical protein
MSSSREITVTEEPTYHRRETDVATAQKQLASQEMWGGPTRNYMGSDTPKVKAYLSTAILAEDRSKQRSRIEFTTAVPTDSYHPVFAYWSGDRPGVRNEDGYAKIKVQITFCNVLD